MLQVDGWGAYNRLAEAKRKGGPLTLAACWAHLRRKFYELHVAGVSHVATETVERMAELWALEESIRGQDPDSRRAARQQQSAAIVAELWHVLGKGTEAHSRQVETRRGDPLCHKPTRGSRTLPA